MIHPDFVVEQDGNFYHQACLLNYEDFVKCQICGQEFNIITAGHLRKHEISMREYRERYGNVVSQRYAQVLARSSRMKRSGRQEQGEGVFLSKEALESLNSRILREIVRVVFNERISRKEDCINRLCGD